MHPATLKDTRRLQPPEVEVAARNMSYVTVCGHFELLLWRIYTVYIPVEPHEAVPEVSKGKVHITQNKHVPIEWFVTTASQSRI